MAAAIRGIKSLDEWTSEWNLFEEDVSKLRQNEYQRVMRAMDEYRSSQEALKNGADAQYKKLQAFGNSLKRLQNQFGDDKTDVATDKMVVTTKKFTEIQQGLPKKAGWFLRACLGAINVSLYWDKYEYKKTYEHFKLRMTFISMAFTMVNLFILNYRFSDALFNAVLVWYYSSLTLQEHILIANGSRIKGWWVLHHYLSILLSGFLLIWPQSVSYQLFRSQFLYFSMYLSLVQFLQNYYQNGVLYRLRALGLSTTMDTTVEGFRSWMWRGLGFLLPFLIIGYVFQLFNAYTLYKIQRDPRCKEWQVEALAWLFLILGVGNLVTLIHVVRQKSSRMPKIPCT